VHQDFYVVVEQASGTNPKPPQRFGKQAFLHWATKLKQRGAEVHAVYEACGFGFTLQRQLSALGIVCHVVCPQKLDERNKRVKTDGLGAKALWLGVWFAVRFGLGFKATYDVGSEPLGKTGDKTPENHFSVISIFTMDCKNHRQPLGFLGGKVKVSDKLWKKVACQQPRDEKNISDHGKDAAH
jgi:hypothetical protein